MPLRALNSLLRFSSVSEWCIKFLHFLPPTSLFFTPPPPQLESRHCRHVSNVQSQTNMCCTVFHPNHPHGGTACAFVCAKAHFQKQLDFTHRHFFCTKITAVTLDCSVVGHKIEVLHKASVANAFVVSLCTDAVLFLPLSGVKHRHNTVAVVTVWGNCTSVQFLGGVSRMYRAVGPFPFIFG